MRSFGHKLIVTSEVIVGSPAALMSLENELRMGTVKAYDNVPKGTYKADIYFVYDHEVIEGFKPAEEDLSAYVMVLSSVDYDEEFSDIWDIPNLG